MSPQNLSHALSLQTRQEARLGTILVTHGWVQTRDLMAALAQQWQANQVDLTARPPDTRLVDQWGASACLRDGLVPWQRIGGATVIVTAWPERFAARSQALHKVFGPVVMALGSEDDIAQSLIALRARHLAQRAESRVPETLSCRAPKSKWHPWRAPIMGLIGIACLVAAPSILGLAVTALAVVTLAAITGLKAAAIVHALLAKRRPAADGGPQEAEIARWPVVSVMVPLFHEEDVASRLMNRLARLTYPRELTDILLVCEEDDATTATALACTDLPTWARVVTVPRGVIQTKPRALNYALDFCRGQIVGIWDAEDAPAPDQLQRVAQRFHNRSPNVACLQGALDYYNARTNWLSRCFTIEYAAWFRGFLPILERLRLPIPLGGTTLFLRRTALESLGAWDAHNVTEDADLGMRLARAGYRTELLETVTEEEANCAMLPWVKQRSRWLKGYALTWAVHMRRPAVLWRDLGPAGFVGFQVLFLATLTQFVLAPFLWTFWVMVFGLWHPLAPFLNDGLLTALVTVFVCSEIVSMGLAFIGLRAAGKATLTPWILTLPAYFPLAVAAVYKGLWEGLRHPFLWHKTVHGLHDGDLSDHNHSSISSP